MKQVVSEVTIESGVVVHDTTGERVMFVELTFGDREPIAMIPESAIELARDLINASRDVLEKESEYGE